MVAGIALVVASPFVLQVEPRFRRHIERAFTKKQRSDSYYRWLGILSALVVLLCGVVGIIGGNSRLH